MKNRTWAEINIDNLLFNIKQLKKQLHKNIHILAAVKANAYGHDSIEISKSIAPFISVFGVASIDEGIELRKNNIKKPILILSPVLISDTKKLINFKLMPNIFSYDYAIQLNSKLKKFNKKLNVHIEIDTGMNRTGIEYKNAVNDILKIYTDLSYISIEGIFSHFAEAEKNSQFTIEQLKRYDIIIKTLINKRVKIRYMHIANSSAILNEYYTYNMVRPGLLLYGHYTAPSLKSKMNLKPVMSVKTRIAQIKHIKKGDSVSYSRTFTAKKDMKIATTLIGYGDGYPRLLSNKAYMIVNGKKAPIIGNICMDLTMIDITKIKNVKVGDEVELFGENVSIDYLAKKSGYINYEILTSIGPRVPRIFIKNSRIYKKKNIMASANRR